MFLKRVISKNLVTIKESSNLFNMLDIGIQRDYKN